MPLSMQMMNNGQMQVHQSLDRPVVYLDHWAVRLFSDNVGMQDRLVAAIKLSAGTLLFSAHNLAEFCALTDLECAKRAERLLDRILPNLYLVDMTADPEFRPPTDVPADAGLKPYWLLEDLLARAQIAGKLTVHRFVTDAIEHREELLPVFNDMATSIANALNADRANPEKVQKAKNFRPGAGMSADSVLMGELLRDVYLNPDAAFTANDASDLVHAVPTLLRCDYVLLDTKWSHKAQVASRRLKKLGFRRRLAASFSAKGDGVGEFLRSLEGLKKS
jgi:hypothetical protein